MAVVERNARLLVTALITTLIVNPTVLGQDSGDEDDTDYDTAKRTVTIAASASSVIFVFIIIVVVCVSCGVRNAKRKARNTQNRNVMPAVTETSLSAFHPMGNIPRETPANVGMPNSQSMFGHPQQPNPNFHSNNYYNNYTPRETSLRVFDPVGNTPIQTPANVGMPNSQSMFGHPQQPSPNVNPNNYFTSYTPRILKSSIDDLPRPDYPKTSWATEQQGRGHNFRPETSGVDSNFTRSGGSYINRGFNYTNSEDDLSNHRRGVNVFPDASRGIPSNVNAVPQQFYSSAVRSYYNVPR